MADTANKKFKEIRREVWKYYKKHGRHDLPWRRPSRTLHSGKQDFDPYKILVSEVMLQQTQVPRVLEKYKSFLKKFPTVRALAKASLSEVLSEWSGLGYNRRGKYLHDAAKTIVKEFKGDMKKALEHPLPGVGPYTRAAVRTFAFNERHPMIETNIRTVFLPVFLDHQGRTFAGSFSPAFYRGRTFGGHFSPEKNQGRTLVEGIGDKELMPLIVEAAVGQDPRTWHWALMDYGAYLKRSGVRNNSLSKHYTKQATFKGSLREVRGAILRQFSPEKNQGRTLVSVARLRKELPFGAERVDEALLSLERDGMLKKASGKWRIA